jgi:Ca-activated chloride channel family protein
MLDLWYELESLQHFHFMRPWWLLLVIPVIFIVRSFSQRQDHLAVWRLLMSKEILDQLTVKGNHDSWCSPKHAMGLVALTASIVLAGPTWRQQASPFTEDRSALIIALDVSETMNQNDVQPSRLLRAKQKIIELLVLRGDSNTALIAYSGSAHIVMPITKDSDMIRHFLDSLDNTLMPKAGKLPQTVLPVADGLLQATQVPGTLLMIGDGASAVTVNNFADYFKDKPHQLVMWAIGDTDLLEPSDKQSSIIPIQLPQLQALTDASAGRLVLMTHDKQDVAQVNRYIENNLVIVDDASRPWFDAGYPLVFVIALLLLFWFRRGWSLQWP